MSRNASCNSVSKVCSGAQVLVKYDHLLLTFTVELMYHFVTQNEAAELR